MITLMSVSLTSNFRRTFSLDFSTSDDRNQCFTNDFHTTLLKRGEFWGIKCIDTEEKIPYFKRDRKYILKWEYLPFYVTEKWFVPPMVHPLPAPLPSERCCSPKSQDLRQPQLVLTCFLDSERLQVWLSSIPIKKS